VPAVYQGLHQVRPDEPFRSGHRDLIRHSLSLL
jgi:hypothetical protein